MPSKTSSRSVTIHVGRNMATIRAPVHPNVRSVLDRTIRCLSKEEPIDWQELCSIACGAISFPRTLALAFGEELQVEGYRVTIDRDEEGEPSSWLMTADDLFRPRESLFAAFATGDRGLALVKSEEDETRCTAAFAAAALRRVDSNVLVLAPRSRFTAIQEGLRKHGIEVLRDGQPILEPAQQVVLAGPSRASSKEVVRFSSIVASGVKPLVVEGAFQNLMYEGGADFFLYGATVTPDLSPLEALRLRALFRDEIGASTSRNGHSARSRVVVLPDPGGAPRKAWSNRSREQGLTSFINEMLLSGRVRLEIDPSVERLLTRLKENNLVVVTESWRHCRRLRKNKTWGAFATVLPPAMARQADLTDAVVFLACHWNPFDLTSFLSPGEFRGRPAAVVLFADADQEVELREEGLVR